MHLKVYMAKVLRNDLLSECTKSYMGNSRRLNEDGFSSVVYPAPSIKSLGGDIHLK